MRVVLALAVALALGASSAGAAALTVNEQHYEAQRVADEARAAATGEVQDARSGAVAARLSLVASTAKSRALAAELRKLTDLTPGWTDQDARTALVSAVDLLEARLGDVAPLDIEKFTTAMIDSPREWSSKFGAVESRAKALSSSLDELARSARDRLDDLARLTVAGGSGISAMSLATEEERDGARTRLFEVADRVRAGLDPLDALTAYATAWSKVHDSQVAAETAAAAAAAAAAAPGGAGSGASGGPGLTGDLAHFNPLAPPDLSNPPYFVLDGSYDPSCYGGPAGLNEWIYGISDGETVYVYSATRYGLTVAPPIFLGAGWAARIDYC